MDQEPVQHVETATHVFFNRFERSFSDHSNVAQGASVASARVEGPGACRCDVAPPAAIFDCSRDRRGEHPQAHLAGCGILQADANDGRSKHYLADRKSGPIREAACWAQSSDRSTARVAEEGPAARRAVSRTLFDDLIPRLADHDR